MVDFTKFDFFTVKVRSRKSFLEMFQFVKIRKSDFHKQQEQRLYHSTPKHIGKK